MKIEGNRVYECNSIIVFHIMPIARDSLLRRSIGSGWARESDPTESLRRLEPIRSDVDSLIENAVNMGLLRRLDSSSVSSTRRARIFEIGVDQQYQPEAQASAYPDPTMIEFIV